MKHGVLRYLLLLFLCCFQLAQADTTLPPDIDRILTRGKLIVAVSSEDIPPFFMQDKITGQLTGYDITLARDIARRLGVDVAFNRQASSFNGVIDLVAKGQADIAISLLSLTLHRAMRVGFTQPYLLLPKTLLVNRLKISKLGWEGHVSELMKTSPNITIGVRANSSYIPYAKQEYPNAKIIPYEEIDQAMHDVEKGKIFAVFYDKVQIQTWLANHPDSALFTQALVLKQMDPVAIAVPWHNTHLQDWLNLYLIATKEDGTQTTLKQTYLNE